MQHKPATTIGSVEQLDFPELGLKAIPAKVDTGADSSSIWATSVSEKDGVLSYVLFDRSSPFFSGQVITTPDFTTVAIRNSFGQMEARYKVKLQIKLAGRTIRGLFTLSDRSQNRFPILLGRRTLRGKFIVDVARTSPRRLEVLLLVPRIQSHTSDFVTGVTDHNNKLDITVATYDDLEFVMGENDCEITLRQSGRSITSYGFVHFKGVIPPYLEVISAAACHLKAYKVPFVDAASASQLTDNKLFQYVVLNDCKIATPISVYVASQYLPGSYEQFVDELGLPFVLKDIHGRKGQNNYLITNQQDFVRASDVAKKHNLAMIAQRFVPNDEDYRILVMGSSVELVVKRQRTDPGSHLNNTSQGAHASLTQLNDLSAEIKSNSVAACDMLGLDIGGVDMVQDKVNGSWYCLEVNEGPQIATGSYLAEKYAAYARFLNREARKLKS